MRNDKRTRIWLIFGILLVLNFLGEEFFYRLDLTEDQRYTLSEATRNILSDLDEPVTVKAYFSEELPTTIAGTKKDFKEMLIEYANLSKGNVVYEFVNPNEDEKIEQEAAQEGIQPVIINVREKNEMKQQKAWLGAVISLGEQKEVIPFMQPGGAMEYALSTAIKKLSVKDKPAIAFLQGNGEPALNDLHEVTTSLNILYKTQPLTLKNDTNPIPGNVRVLAIVNPKDSIQPEEFKKIEHFLDRGGRLFVAMQRVQGNLQTSYGNAVNTGLETWLKGRGIAVDDQFVIDANCAAVTVQQQQGFFRFASNVSFPFIPVIQQFAGKHPVSEGLESVMLQFPAAIRFTGDTSMRFTPLAYTSDKSGLLKAPQYFDIRKQWTESDFPEKKLVVAAALEGKLGSPKGMDTRLIVVANGNFAVSGSGQQSQRLQPDNLNLFVNSVDWLADDTGLILLRTRGVTSRPIKELEDGTQMLLKWFNFLFPLLLIIGYGIIRMMQRRNERIKRMEESYE